MPRSATLSAGVAVATGLVGVALAAAPLASAAAPTTFAPVGHTCVGNSTSPLRAITCNHTTGLTSQVINQGNSFKVVFSRLEAGSILTISLDGVTENNNCGTASSSKKFPKGADANTTKCTADKNGNLSVIIFTPTGARVKQTNITVNGFDATQDQAGKFIPFYEQDSIKIVKRTAPRS